MNDQSTRSPCPEWDPLAPDALSDQRSVYDDLRSRCPVAHSDLLGWSVLTHADVLTVLNDHDTYRNHVSQHLSVPNGMDQPEHTPYRRLVEPYFAPDPMARFAPVCDTIAADLIATTPRGQPIEVMDSLGHEFAVRVQCAFMGWPHDLHEPLREWVREQHRATLAEDRGALAASARRFDDVVHEVLDERRTTGTDSPDDPTSRLLSESIDGRHLTDAEIVSIIRNWTVGELATIAASVGIIVAYLAHHPDVEARLRADPSAIAAAVHEILRIDAPLIANRRITAHPATIAETPLPSGAKVTVLWASANRDEGVFGDPDDFRLDRDPSLNLLYGAGIHVCPGAPLARLELQSYVAAFLDGTQRVRPVSDPAPVRASYPTGGYRSAWVVLDDPPQASH
ncbi:MAG: cytochrome P450 [Ilumatobacteraceae bacterium]|nr:cytochrome P450 [Ilumatobacteraceae bacterium]